MSTALREQCRFLDSTVTLLPNHHHRPRWPETHPYSHRTNQLQSHRRLFTSSMCMFLHHCYDDDLIPILSSQLRDLIICPRERGIVNYVQQKAIVEQNINAPGAVSSPYFSGSHNFDLFQPTRILSHLHFTPNSLTHLPVGVNDTLIAAGGQESEIHLSLHTSTSSRSNRTRQVWEYEHHLSGSINNSVLLTSLSLTRSNESSVEPRVGVSNNDGSVKLYNVPMRVHNKERKLPEVGVIKLDVPINHCMFSFFICAHSHTSFRQPQYPLMAALSSPSAILTKFTSTV